MQRKNGIFYTSAINLCLDYHLTGNGPQAPRLAKGNQNSVQLDKYGLPAWMGLDCDVRGLRPPYRVGMCKVDGMSLVKQTRNEYQTVPNVFTVKMRCRGEQELEEWPSAKFAVESGIISSAEPPQNPGAKKENQFGSLELCGNQILDAPRHRRDVVPVTAGN